MPRPISPMERMPMVGLGGVEEVAIVARLARDRGKRCTDGGVREITGGRNRAGTQERATDIGCVIW